MESIFPAARKRKKNRIGSRIVMITI